MSNKLNNLNKTLSVAAQLYIFSQLPDLTAQTPELLDSLAEAGYDAVEGMYGKPPYTLAEMLPSGLRYYAPHLTPPQITEGVAFAQTMHATDICTSGPLVWNKRTPSDWAETATILNTQGAILREKNIHLHYHNHDFEFVDKTFDAFIAQLDPNSISLCFDAGWAALAGHDPVAFLQQHVNRIGVLHLRDFAGTVSTALGEGDIDIAPVIAQIPNLPNLRMLVVEHDPTDNNPLGAMVRSRHYLREQFGL
jgi:sugar phosphate isomerase/epimerase